MEVTQKRGVRSRPRLSCGSTADGAFDNSWAKVSGGDTAGVPPANPDLDIFVCAAVQDVREWSLSRGLTSASDGRRLDLRCMGGGSGSCSAPWSAARRNVPDKANRRAVFKI
jgi:hypothetical protein